MLAVALRRPFFERLLAASVPTAAGRDDKGACRQSEVVLQWDPDHTPDGGKHARRAVQVAAGSGSCSWWSCKLCLRASCLRPAGPAHLMLPHVQERAAVRSAFALTPAAACPRPPPFVQLGVRGGLRDDYISGQHIVSIEDITPFVREMRQRVQHAGAAAQGWCQLVTPAERVVRVSEALRRHIAADSWDDADT